MSRNSKQPVLVLRLLRAVAHEWRTVNELAPVVGVRVRGLRNWLTALTNERALRMRNRPREMQEDGNKPPGPEPREYKLSSKWSDLW